MTDETPTPQAEPVPVPLPDLTPAAVPQPPAPDPSAAPAALSGSDSLDAPESSSAPGLASAVELPPASDISAVSPLPPAPIVPQVRRPLHRPSLILAIFNGLALLVAGLAALAFFASGLYALGGRGGGVVAARSVISYSWITTLVAAVQVPALVFNIARLSGRRLGRGADRGLRLKVATLVLVIGWPLALVGGTFLNESNSATAVFLSGLVQVLAVGIPIWWLLTLGRRGLRGTSHQRTWGLASLSMAFTVPVIVLAETAGLVLAVVMGVMVVMAQPELATRVQSLLNSMRFGTPDPQQVLSMLEPYLNQPWVLFAVFAAIAGFAPMLEEMLKPLAAWFLARREITSAQGFSAGLVAGGSFALLESLSYVNSSAGSATTGDPLGNWVWALSVVVRGGTAVVHIASSGLVGWGLAEAWRRERYLRLGGLFLLAVGIHGAWNALALLQGFGELFPTNRLGSFQGVASFAWIGLVVLLAVSLGVLILGNRRIRARQEAEEAELAATPPAPPSFDPYAQY